MNTDLDKILKNLKDKPEYVPIFFYQTVRMLKYAYESNYKLPTKKSKESTLIYYDRVEYLNNFIKENIILKDFYIKFADNINLLNDILAHFQYLPQWYHRERTTGNYDYEIANKIIKQLRNCLSLMEESYNVKRSINAIWYKNINNFIDYCFNDLTDKGLEIKEITKQFLTPVLTDNIKLKKNGYTKSYIYSWDSPHNDIINIFENLANELESINYDFKNKVVEVKKVKNEKADLVYTVKVLKKLFVKHKVNKRKHIKFITVIINGIMGEKSSEDRIRKILE